MPALAPRYPKYASSSTVRCCGTSLTLPRLAGNSAVPPLDKGAICGSPFDADGALQNADDVESVVPADRLRLVEVPAIHDELFACHQTADPGTVGRLGLHGIDRPTLEINDRQALLDVQRTRLAVGADAVPIVEAERGIAGLLHFGDQEARTQGVNGSGGNEEAIARLGLEMVQQFLARPLANGIGQLLPIDARPEPRVDRAAGIGGQNVPGLGLAQVGRIQPCGLFVVGMDLNRERLSGVKELHQERKTRLRVVAAEKFRTALANQFAQGRAGQRPLVDDALVRAVIGRLPNSRRNRCPGRSAFPGMFPSGGSPRDSAARASENEADKAGSSSGSFLAVAGSHVE